AKQSEGCPACGVPRGQGALTWISLIGPAGCEEDVCLRQCAGCGAAYLDVLEDGPPHLEPANWFAGPLHPLLARLVIERVALCFERDRSNCRCSSHLFVRNILHPEAARLHVSGTPWAMEEQVPRRPGGVASTVLDRALALARRVHGEQVRGDGAAFLE